MNLIKTIFRSAWFKILRPFTSKPSLDKFLNWTAFQKKLIYLWWIDAPQYQVDIERGAYYIRKGTVYQVGQPFKINRDGKVFTRYIDNLFYNFKANKVTHKFTNKPIKGYSEPFINK